MDPQKNEETPDIENNNHNEPKTNAAYMPIHECATSPDNKSSLDFEQKTETDNWLPHQNTNKGARSCVDFLFALYVVLPPPLHESSNQILKLFPPIKNGI